MPTDELLAAASKGDLREVARILATLTDAEIVSVFNLTARLVDQPRASFLIHLWVTSRPRPKGELGELAWLRAMNNGTQLAITEGSREAKYEMVTRAMQVAPDNIAIFHNAACVYCALGQPDEAIDAVVSAHEYGYHNMMLIKQDSDLALIQDHPGFVALLAEASKGQQEELAARLVQVSARVLRGAEAPKELRRCWQGHLVQCENTPGPPHIRDLYDDAVPNSVRRQNGIWAWLWPELDVAAQLRRGGLIAFYRGQGREPSDGPVLILRPEGAFQLCDTFSEALVLLANEYGGHDLVMLRLFLINTHQFDVELDAEVIRARVCASHGPLAKDIQAKLREQSMSQEAAEAARFAPLCEGQPTTQVYLPFLVPAPLSPESLMRLGGPPIGVSPERRPMDDGGALLPHLLTLDLREVPAVAAYPCFADIPGLRALAVFDSVEMPEGGQVLLLTQDDIDTQGLWQGEAVADPIPMAWAVQPMLIPQRALQEDDSDLEAELCELLRTRAIGGPPPSTPQAELGTFVMVFDDAFDPDYQVSLYTNGLVYE